MGQTGKESGRFVVPGERLGVIEEFTPDERGTYTEGGVVYSKIVGRTLLDVLNKQVSVYPLARRVSVPRPGSVVTGQVSGVQSKQATVRIMKIGKRDISGFFTGLLHISDVSPGYVETMFDVCKLGDILRARVVSDKNRTYHLSTADIDLGVVYALCSECGGILVLQGQRLRCPNCGKAERRKFVLDYGKGTI